MWLVLLFGGSTSAWAMPQVAGTDAAMGDAEEREPLTVPADDRRVGEVVGGKPAKEGAWPDAAGIVFNGAYVGCTGTLVHPRVVLTAGHCVGNITDVLLDATNWIQDGGEIIPVQRVFEFPDSWATYDAAALLLERRAKTPHRPIAADCIVDSFLVPGADVAVVGFGNTDESGRGQTSVLHEGITQVQDPDGVEQFVGDVWTGFNPSVQPGGELGAGGNGVDACFGDSGGPLYLLTPKGDYLTGITSRAYAGVSQRYPCRDGGVYVRPDALLDWVEERTGVTLERPSCNTTPVAVADPIVLGGDGGETTIAVFDPDPFHEGFRFEVTSEPASGTVTISEDGQVRYTPIGRPVDDVFRVMVTDDGSPWEASGPASTEVVIDVFAPACGCSAPGGPGGVLLWGWAPMWWLRRRSGDHR